MAPMPSMIQYPISFHPNRKPECPALWSCSADKRCDLRWGFVGHVGARVTMVSLSEAFVLAYALCRSSFSHAPLHSNIFLRPGRLSRRQRVQHPAEWSPKWNLQIAWPGWHLHRLLQEIPVHHLPGTPCGPQVHHDQLLIRLRLDIGSVVIGFVSLVT